MKNDNIYLQSSMVFAISLLLLITEKNKAQIWLYKSKVEVQSWLFLTVCIQK